MPLRRLWRTLCHQLRLSFQVTPYLPLRGNGAFRAGLDLESSGVWTSRSNQYLFQVVHSSGSLKTFEELRRDHGWRSTDWLSYLQLSSYVNSLPRASLTDRCMESISEVLSLSAQVPIPLRFHHRHLQEQLGEPSYDTIALRWTQDFPCEVTASMIRRGSLWAVRVTHNVLLFELNYKFLHRLYRSTSYQFRAKMCTSDQCLKCLHSPSTLGHQFWSCARISAFWHQLNLHVQLMWTYNFTLAPIMLFTLESIPLSAPKGFQSFLSKAVLLGKKAILLCWITADSPTLSRWRTLMIHQASMERLGFSSLDSAQGRSFCTCWLPFCDTLTPRTRSHILNV
uniref:Uncharacterized protein LOC117360673 isoform X1 n=1 Tax=Geotrypetes seraphini TaxID=260995 RepID=A0A6P8RG59_GEOSA|nr:uncharacterized protein LOC117360673 isoform X1 [Geotrypetes seraphini]